MRKEKTLGLEKKKVTAIGNASYYFGVLPFVMILSLRKLRGFLLYGFLEEKKCVHSLFCLIVVLVILSVKDPNNASLKLKR